MFRMLIALSLLIYPPLVSSVQDLNKDEGAAFYEVTFKSGAIPVPENTRKVLLFRSRDKSLEVVDITARTRVRGVSKDDKTMVFRFTNDVQSVDTNAKYLIYTIAGSIGDDRISGRVDFEGKTVYVLEGVELPSVWACSNHKDPVHTATSEDEMHRLTSLFNCAGWHKLKSSD